MRKTLPMTIEPTPPVSNYTKGLSYRVDQIVITENGHRFVLDIKPVTFPYDGYPLVTYEYVEGQSPRLISIEYIEKRSIVPLELR